MLNRVHHIAIIGNAPLADRIAAAERVKDMCCANILQCGSNTYDPNCSFDNPSGQVGDYLWFTAPFQPKLSSSVRAAIHAAAKQARIDFHYGFDLVMD